jgi:hypothetical protein
MVHAVKMIEYLILETEKRRVVQANYVTANAVPIQTLYAKMANA